MLLLFSHMIRALYSQDIKFMKLYTVHRYPAISGVIRRYPALSGVIRRYPALSGVIRRYPAWYIKISLFKSIILILSIDNQFFSCSAEPTLKLECFRITSPQPV
jgi:hypothetical protein